MRFRFIAAEKANHAVPILCRCVRVTRSGFYAWCRRPESTHTRDDRRLKVLVHVAFEESKHRYGSPRIHADLLEQQEQVSRKRVVRLMQEDGLVARARKRYKVTTMSDHDQPVAANLLGVTCSMSRRGNCYDNAVMEAFFGACEPRGISSGLPGDRTRGGSACRW